jgi:hypothetical protein
VWEGPLTPDQLNQLIDDDVDGLCYDKVDLKRKHVKERARGRKEEKDIGGSHLDGLHSILEERRKERRNKILNILNRASVWMVS